MKIELNKWYEYKHKNDEGMILSESYDMFFQKEGSDNYYYYTFNSDFKVYGPIKKQNLNLEDETVLIKDESVIQSVNKRAIQKVFEKFIGEN